MGRNCRDGHNVDVRSISQVLIKRGSCVVSGREEVRYDERGGKVM